MGGWGSGRSSGRPLKEDGTTIDLALMVRKGWVVDERLFAIQRRLGCETGWDMPIRRPKGMWRRTYERLENRYWELDAECSREMALAFAMLRKG